MVHMPRKQYEHHAELIGLLFGSWTVIGKARNQNGGPAWKCRCVCGIVRVVPAWNLVHGRSTRCASCAGESRWINLSGQKFGRWTFLYFLRKDGTTYWYKCKCECGNVLDRSAHNITNGASKSCGCYRSESMTRRNSAAKNGKPLAKIRRRRPSKP